MTDGPDKDASTRMPDAGSRDLDAGQVVLGSGRALLAAGLLLFGAGVAVGVVLPSDVDLSGDGRPASRETGIMSQEEARLSSIQTLAGNRWMIEILSGDGASRYVKMESRRPGGWHDATSGDPVAGAMGEVLDGMVNRLLARQAASAQAR
jgi:hypothetical protein